MPDEPLVGRIAEAMKQVYTRQKLRLPTLALFHPMARAALAVVEAEPLSSGGNMNTVMTYEVTMQSGPGAHTVSQRVWPCNCGETHRGTYAQEDWFAHSVCDHREIVDVGIGIAYCVQCSRAFEISNSEEA